MKKILLGISDNWSMSHLSQRTSEPAYYIEDCRILVKYGSEEKGSFFCKCSILLGFIMSKKTKRFVISSSDKSSERNVSCFFDIIKPRRIEHLQKEELFSSDPYFSLLSTQLSLWTCIITLGKKKWWQRTLLLRISWL